jgi:predicted amidohydrolase
MQHRVRYCSLEIDPGMIRITVVQAGTEHSRNGNPGLERNLDLLLELARASTRETPDLVVFPEYSTLGWPYPPEAVVNGSAETIPGSGPQFARYVRLARDIATPVLGWLVERDGERLYNTAFLLLPDGQVLGKYRKVQANLGEQINWGWSQGERFQVLSLEQPGVPGTLPFRFGVSICADMWFPETVRCNELLGAELVIHQSIADDMGHLVPARAFDSGIPIVMCIFNGGSYAVDATGQLLGKAPATDPAWLTVTLDLRQVKVELSSRLGGRRRQASLRTLRNVAAYDILTDPATRPDWVEVFCHADGSDVTEEELRQRFGARYRRR